MLVADLIFLPQISEFEYGDSLPQIRLVPSGEPSPKTTERPQIRDRPQISDWSSRTTLLPQINGQRDAITNLYLEQEGLDDKSRKQAVEYVDDFFEIIGDRRKTNRGIVGACLRMP